MEAFLITEENLSGLQPKSEQKPAAVPIPKLKAIKENYRARRANQVLTRCPSQAQHRRAKRHSRLVIGFQWLV